MTLTAHIDHIALEVKDLKKVVSFYTDTLDFAPLNVEEYFAKKANFPSVRISPSTILDFFASDKSAESAGLNNANHICFSIDKDDFPAFRKRLVDAGIDVPDPVSRSGAKGQGHSVYIHDPEQNMLEFRYYD